MFSEKYLNLSHVFLFGRRDPQEVLKKVSKKIAYTVQFLMDLTTHQGKPPRLVRAKRR